MPILFDEEYFERGNLSGVSCYENYRWLRKPTLEYCKAVIKFLGVDREEPLLDFGCAKGFYVKAFRALGIDAWGSDISKYATENCDIETKRWIRRIAPREVWLLDDLHFDFCFCKDALEHIKDLKSVLISMRKNCEQALIGVPLGDNGKYRLPRAHNDVTHVHCENEDWWSDQFNRHYKGVNVYYKIPGIILREGDDPKGYGYFLCR